MSGAMSHRKGVRAEVAAVNWLRAHGHPDARRYLSGDGLQPGDIDAIPAVCLDVKDCVAFEPQKWLRQVAAEAGPHRLPVVWAKLRGETDPGQWMVLLRAADFFDLLDDEPEQATA